METRRREFLRQISGVTALGSLLGRDTRAGSSQDVSSAETQTISYLESLRAQFPVQRRLRPPWPKGQVDRGPGAAGVYKV